MSPRDRVARMFNRRLTALIGKRAAGEQALHGQKLQSEPAGIPWGVVSGVAGIFIVALLAVGTTIFLIVTLILLLVARKKEVSTLEQTMSE